MLAGLDGQASHDLGEELLHPSVSWVVEELGHHADFFAHGVDVAGVVVEWAVLLLVGSVILVWRGGFGVLLGGYLHRELRVLAGLGLGCYGAAVLSHYVVGQAEA